MKNIIPLSILGILLLSGIFLAFTDSSDSEFLTQLQASNATIADQTECIDDLESTLYDFSYEIIHLRTQNEFLIEENENLRLELRNKAKKVASLKAKMLNLEVENHNVKRQLEQVLIGREIRAKHKSNQSSKVDIADIMPGLDEDVAETESAIAVQKMQNKLKTIASEMSKNEELLEAINIQNKETIATIEANEAKIQFNIDIKPASDPAVEFSDPLVTNSVLFNDPANMPKFFTEITLDTEAEDIAEIDADIATEDDLRSKSPIYSLVENTNVVYNYIACRSDRYGKKIKKLKKNGKNWKYTFLQFNLETENINLLLNKEFRMRVLSTDLNTYLKFNTDKKVKTVSHFDFTYEGEPIKVSLFNKDIKGESFEIQIFHMKDGQEYLLEDDQQALFSEGQNVLGKMILTTP